MNSDGPSGDAYRAAAAGNGGASWEAAYRNLAFLVARQASLVARQASLDARQASLEDRQALSDCDGLGDVWDHWGDGPVREGEH